MQLIRVYWSSIKNSLRSGGHHRCESAHGHREEEDLGVLPRRKPDLKQRVLLLLVLQRLLEEVALLLQGLGFRV